MPCTEYSLMWLQALTESHITAATLHCILCVCVYVCETGRPAGPHGFNNNTLYLNLNLCGVITSYTQWDPPPTQTHGQQRVNM